MYRLRDSAYNEEGCDDVRIVVEDGIEVEDEE